MTATEPMLLDVPPSFFEQAESTGQYTAERLRERKPQVYQAIIALLGAGAGIRAIKRICGVHHNSIYAVAEREQFAIDTHKTLEVKNLKRFISVATERLADEVENIKLEALPLAVAIAIDKHELLTGGATARVEHDVSGRARTWEEWQAKLRDPGSDIGLSGGENGQRVIDVELEMLPAPRPDPGTHTDMQSTDIPE